MNQPAPPEAQPPSPAPWWRHGHVWLVVAGPVVAVVAGIATLVLALRTPDPLVAQDYYRRGVEINRTLQSGPGTALLPAMQGRNHAASPPPPPAPGPGPGPGR